MAGAWLLLAVAQSYVAVGSPQPPAPAAHLTNAAVLALVAVATHFLARRASWLSHPLLPTLVAATPLLVGLGPADAWGMLLYSVGGLTAGAALLRALPAHPALLLVTIPSVLVLPALERVIRESGAQGLLKLDASSALASELAWSIQHNRALPPGLDVGPPVVIVSIDTLRADDAEAMISLGRVEARGARWGRATSTASWTLPALASLQTGQAPQEHGAHCAPSGPCQGLAADATPLAETLRQRGYRTAAFVANAWITPTTGFDRGFDEFRAMAGMNVDLPFDLRSTPAETIPRAHEVIDAAIRWLQNNNHPSYYLWIHLIDPHLPYFNASDPAFRTLLGSDLRNGFVWSEQRQQALRAAYRHEVHLVDLQVQRLLDALETEGVLDRGVLVLTSDHGEEFWEHGAAEHGHSHHAEVLEVPLVLLAPGLVQRGRRTDLASILDVASTVRFAVGLPSEGVDLRRVVPVDRRAQAWGNLFGTTACSSWDAGRHVLASPCHPAAAASYDRVADASEQWPQRASPDDPLLLDIARLREPEVQAEGIDPGAGLRALGYVD